MNLYELAAAWRSRGYNIFTTSESIKVYKPGVLLLVLSKDTHHLHTEEPIEDLVIIQLIAESIKWVDLPDSTIPDFQITSKDGETAVEISGEVQTDLVGVEFKHMLGESPVITVTKRIGS